MSAVVASFFALFWSMVLLSVVMLIAALFMCQLASQTLEDAGANDEFRAWLYHHYGTSSRASWTFFELTFSGGWPSYVRPLVEKLGWGYAVFFTIYISSVTFAMFRIITALFLKDTLKIAALDLDNSIHEKITEKELCMQRLADFFYAADASGDGVLTLEELDGVLADERVRAYLSTLELDAIKLRAVFGKQCGDSQVCIDDFVREAMHLKGAARSQDIAALHRDVEDLLSTLQGVRSELRVLGKATA